MWRVAEKLRVLDAEGPTPPAERLGEPSFQDIRVEIQHVKLEGRKLLRETLAQYWELVSQLIIILLLMLREILKLSAIEHWARMRSSDNALLYVIQRG